MILAISKVDFIIIIYECVNLQLTPPIVSWITGYSINYQIMGCTYSSLDAQSIIQLVAQSHFGFQNEKL